MKPKDLASDTIMLASLASLTVDSLPPAPVTFIDHGGGNDPPETIFTTTGDASKDDRTTDVVSLFPTLFSSQSDLLCAPLLRSLVERDVSTMSPVQKATLKRGVQERQDMCIQSKSGTGKTLCFGLILLQQCYLWIQDQQVEANFYDPIREQQSGTKIRESEVVSSTRDAQGDASLQSFFGLVIAPTRELCMQVTHELQQLGCHFRPRIRICCFFGGVPLVDDSKSILYTKPNIIVSTLGRIVSILRYKRKRNKQSERGNGGGGSRPQVAPRLLSTEPIRPFESVPVATNRYLKPKYSDKMGGLFANEKKSKSVTIENNDSEDEEEQQQKPSHHHAKVLLSNSVLRKKDIPDAHNNKSSEFIPKKDTKTPRETPELRSSAAVSDEADQEDFETSRRRPSPHEPHESSAFASGSTHLFTTGRKYSRTTTSSTANMSGSMACSTVLGKKGLLLKMLGVTQMLVIDEADLLLSHQFRNQIEHLLSVTVRPSTQVLLLSATFPLPFLDYVEDFIHMTDKQYQRALTVCSSPSIGDDTLSLTKMNYAETTQRVIHRIFLCSSLVIHDLTAPKAKETPPIDQLPADGSTTLGGNGQGDDDDTKAFPTSCTKLDSVIRANLPTPVLQGMTFSSVNVGDPSTANDELQAKLDAVIFLLQTIRFRQSIIFCNHQISACYITESLDSLGVSCVYTWGRFSAGERLKKFAKLKKHRCRVMVCSDVLSRGIDSTLVDLVIQFDIASDKESFLHRSGRAARYGQRGHCICLCTEEDKSSLDYFVYCLKLDLITIQNLLQHLHPNTSYDDLLAAAQRFTPSHLESNIEYTELQDDANPATEVDLTVVPNDRNQDDGALGVMFERGISIDYLFAELQAIIAEHKTVGEQMQNSAGPC